MKELPALVRVFAYLSLLTVGGMAAFPEMKILTVEVHHWTLCLPRIVSVALNGHPCGTLIADLIDELATLLAVALGGRAVYGLPRRVPPSAENPFC